MTDRRRAKGSGSVRQRPDGRWEGRCMIDGKRVSFYGDKQNEVIKKMRAAQKSNDDGTYTEPKRMNFGKWLETWLEEYVNGSVKPNTYRLYNIQIQTHITPALGKIKLQSLDTVHIQKFYNDIQGDVSPATVRSIHSIIRTALNKAIKLRYITLNPATSCTLPRVNKKEVQPFSEEQMASFLEAIKEDDMKYIFTVALFTGMRKGELCGLPWNAIDFQKGTITIMQQLQNGVIISPKSNKPRTLKPAPFVMDILRNVKKEQNNAHLKIGFLWKNEFNLVFTDNVGEPLNPQKVYYRFKEVAEKIGAHGARFHDLRHTYAVTALQEGDDIKTVQQALGHATASFTLDVYGHVSEKMLKASSERMQSYFEKIKA